MKRQYLCLEHIFSRVLRPWFTSTQLLTLVLEVPYQPPYPADEGGGAPRAPRHRIAQGWRQSWLPSAGGDFKVRPFSCLHLGLKTEILPTTPALVSRKNGCGW